MNTSNTKVRAIGFLILLAMAVSIAGNLVLMPVLSAPDLLESISTSAFEIRLHAVLMLVNCISVAAIGALSFQVFINHSGLLAISYALARVIESVLLIFGIISVLSLIHVGQRFAALDGTESAYLFSQAKAATGNNWYAYHIAMISLGLGSLAFCYTLLKFRLVPSYLAILGLLGYSVLATTSVLSILGIDLGLIVTLPVFLFEVAVGFYLVVRGFPSSWHQD